MTYLEIKLIHETAAAISITGFVARGAGTLRRARWLERRDVRMVPHVVDTVLLASAVVLAWQLRLSPLAAPWLAAKIIGLVVYIALGMVALRFGRTLRTRATALAAAVAVFAWIVSVAFTKDPRGFLVWLSG